jgi:hypothetical protein
MNKKNAFVRDVQKKHEKVEQADLAQGKAEKNKRKKNPGKETNDVHLHFDSV